MRRFLEKLFPSKKENNKKQKEETKIVKTSMGYKIERNGALLRNATAEEVQKAQEQHNILDLTRSEEKTKEVPKPGEIFDVQGRKRTINPAGVEVKPTSEQLKNWEKEQENK